MVRELDPGLDVRIAPALGKPEEIDTALAWWPQPGCSRRCRTCASSSRSAPASITCFSDPDLPDVPIVRFVDPDLTGRMVEYVALHVLYHHRRMSEFRELQARKVWKYVPEPAAHEVRVGVMGLGVLGARRGATRSRCSATRCAAGAARRSRSTASPASPAAGELDAFLADTDILAVLLPLTPRHARLIDRRCSRSCRGGGRDARLPGPVLINAGRGGLQVDADILASAGGGRALRRLARRVRGRAAAALEPAVVASARRRHAAQRRRERARRDRALHAAPDGGAKRGEPLRTSSTAGAGIEGDVIPAGARQRGEPGPRGHNHSRRPGSRIFRWRNSGMTGLIATRRSRAGWCGSAAPAGRPAASSTIISLKSLA